MDFIVNRTGSANRKKDTKQEIMEGKKRGRGEANAPIQRSLKNIWVFRLLRKDVGQFSLGVCNRVFHRLEGELEKVLMASVSSLPFLITFDMTVKADCLQLSP